MVELEQREIDILIEKSIQKFEEFNPILIDKDIEINKDKINQFKYYKTTGIVYQFCKKSNGILIPVYIGKCKNHITRFRAHLCGIGQGTQSRHIKILDEIENKREIYLRFIETKPYSLRNLIEEELTDYYKNKEFDLWNFKK